MPTSLLQSNNFFMKLNENIVQKDERIVQKTYFPYNSHHKTTI